MTARTFDVLVAALVPAAREHWDASEERRELFNDGDCRCYLCNTLIAAKAQPDPRQTQSGQGDPSGGNPYTGPRRVDLQSMAEYASRNELTEQRARWRKLAIAADEHRCAWSDRFMATDAALTSELRANEHLTRQVARLSASVASTRKALQSAQAELERQRKR